MNIKKVSVITLSIKLILSLVVLMPNNALAFLSVYVPAVSAMFEENLSLEYGLASIFMFLLHVVIISLYTLLKGKISGVFGVLTLFLLIGDIIFQIFFYIKNLYIFSGVMGIVFDIVCITMVILTLSKIFRKSLIGEK